MLIGCNWQVGIWGISLSLSLPLALPPSQGYQLAACWPLRLMKVLWCAMKSITFPASNCFEFGSQPGLRTHLAADAAIASIVPNVWQPRASVWKLNADIWDWPPLTILQCCMYLFCLFPFHALLISEIAPSLFPAFLQPSRKNCIPRPFEIPVSKDRQVNLSVPAIFMVDSSCMLYISFGFFWVPFMHFSLLGNKYIDLGSFFGALRQPWPCLLPRAVCRIGLCRPVWPKSAYRASLDEMSSSPNKIETDFFSVLVGFYSVLHFYPLFGFVIIGCPSKMGLWLFRDRRRPGQITSIIGMYGDCQCCTQTHV